MIDSYIFYKEKLNGEYKNKFEQIDKYCAILLEGVDSDAQNDIMSEILDSLLSAQNNNIPVTKIIGDDVSKFCEQACSNIPIKYRIKNILKLFRYWAWIELIFAIPDVIIGLENTSLWDIKTEIGSFIAFLPLVGAFEIIYLNIAKLKVKKDLKQNKIGIFTKLLPIIFATCLVVICMLCTKYIQWDMPIWIDILISLIIIIIYQLIYRKQKREKIGFSTIVANEEIQNEKYRFNKLNDKLTKKGKKNLTEKEYLEREIKKAKNAKINAKVDVIVAILVALAVAVGNYFKEGLEDSVIMFFVLLFIESVVLVPYYIWINKLSNKLLLKYKYWLENDITKEEWELDTYK